MPGSLLLSNDAYSELSETSGRSLDSKLGGKKVSFNKAVRVKQYPWESDFDQNSGDHLTLPSNRFWFKVYKNKREPPNVSNGLDTYKRNAWGEESMEHIHDTLAPIAEVEDQDLDSKASHLQYLRNPQDVSKQNGEQSYPSPSNNYNNSTYHPIEPPVDYFDEMHLSSNNNFNRAKTVWETNDTSQGRYNYNTDHDTSGSLWNHSPYRRHGTHEESEEIVNGRNFVGANEELSKVLKLPRMAIQNNSPFRRSVRKLESASDSKTRERRSRSHDDQLDNENRFKQLRKADKSVSTDDLNFSNDDKNICNRFLRDSRDIATQCYGTLDRNKKDISYGRQITSNYTQDCEIDRLNKFKSPASSKSVFNGDSSNVSPKMGQLKNINQRETSSKRIRPDYDVNNRKNLHANDRNLSYKKHDVQVNGKVNNGVSKVANRGENFAPDPIENTNSFKSHFSRTDLQSNSQYGFGKTVGNPQIKTNRDSVTIGYLRGRQIPLSEVNTNTNRKIFNRNESVTNRNLFRKAAENVISPANHISKPDVQTSNGLSYKKFTSSNLENSNRRNLKNGSQSAKSYASVNGDSSMIDWSLSGFQLTTKPDNAITSVSDSEYTVHRRPPLLMYIPGVSHHDRPAIEDDRLSALSDLSRSEINDGLSSRVSNSSQDKTASSDIRRRYSMPRDGKLKWIRWKNKG